MNIDSFKSVRTVEDMKNRLSIMSEASKEHYIPYESLLKVQGTDYYDLTYYLSASKDGFIIAHYFTYKDKDTDCVGLCELPIPAKALKSIASPIYNQLNAIHPLLWIGMNINGLYSIIVNGKVLTSDILSYDLLDIGGSIQFLQLEYKDGTSLVCLDMWNNVSGVAPMSSKEEFKEWFEFVVMKRGYEGKLDHLTISDLFQLYFEVINTIFGVSKFKPIRSDEK